MTYVEQLQSVMRVAELCRLFSNKQIEWDEFCRRVRDVLGYYGMEGA